MASVDVLGVVGKSLVDPSTVIEPHRVPLVFAPKPARNPIQGLYVDTSTIDDDRVIKAIARESFSLIANQGCFCGEAFLQLSRLGPRAPLLPCAGFSWCWM